MPPWSRHFEDGLMAKSITNAWTFAGYGICPSRARKVRWRECRQPCQRSAGQKSRLAGITMTHANLVNRQGEHRTPVLEGLHGRVQRRSKYADGQK